MKFHFISGLPRSGSTLLASLLRQNPRFATSIMSPLGQILVDTLTAMGATNEAHGFISDTQRSNVLRAMFKAFYADAGRAVTFDNNRRWTANASLVATLYPDAKIICCVRHPAAIVDSFERLFRANPLRLSKIHGGVANTTVYGRTQTIMDGDGVLGYALNAFRDAYFGPERKRLVIVNYDDLCRFPKQVLEDLHAALHEPMRAYDFNRIDPIPDSAAFDQHVSTPGLHDLKSKVVYEKRDSILPPDLYARLPKPFWLPVEPVKETATKPG